jgi:hypothetical protein
MDSTSPWLTYILTASPTAACFEGQSSLIESTQGSCWLDTIVYIGIIVPSIDNGLPAMPDSSS